MSHPLRQDYATDDEFVAAVMQDYNDILTADGSAHADWPEPTAAHLAFVEGQVRRALILGDVKEPACIVCGLPLPGWHGDDEARARCSTHAT